jgi:RNA polymerase sigma factor (sigma-70 family)
VQACLQGDQRAWETLIARYKRLIYALPLRYGASTEDAADVFQLVCTELFTELPRLRNTENLRPWLMTVTAHQSYHWKRKWVKRVTNEAPGASDDELAATPDDSDFSTEVEREQFVRVALERLPERCRVMVQLLFFNQPPLSYIQVAEKLGLATGSIGFIRGRCLKRLQRVLEELGW